MKEAEVCEKFKALMEDSGWVVYPETSDWDLVCVGPRGVQVGVEAKGRANIMVLYQALHGDRFPGCKKIGPDYHAVLVPKAVPEFKKLAHILGVIVFDYEDITKFGANSIDRFRLRLGWLSEELDNPMLWNHSKPLWTPPVVVEVPAGVQSPVKVTQWKVSAVRLCMLLRERGYITTRDFRDFGIRLTVYWRWRLKNSGRMKVPALKGEGSTSVAKYVPNGKPLPDEEFPEVLTSLQSLDKAAA